MAIGKINVTRPQFRDDTTFPKDIQVVTREGDAFRITQKVKLRRWSRFTSFMVWVTFSIWPFGQHQSIEAVRDERLEPRDD